MIVSFIAIPGAGKSTQINQIVKSGTLRNVIVLSVPALCGKRELDLTDILTKEELQIINDCKSETDEKRILGQLAPFALDTILFNVAIRLSKKGKTVILDGAPRGLRQAKLFLHLLSEKELSSFKIVELYFKENEYKNSQDRQFYRAIKKSPLVVEEAIKRITKISNKIDVFMKDTKIGLQFLKEKNIAIGRFNASESKELITSQIISFLTEQ